MDYSKKYQQWSESKETFRIIENSTTLRSLVVFCVISGFRLEKEETCALLGYL
jgi:hypothetical protein